MGFLLYQTEYQKATLAQFQAHLKKELTGCCPERVINAASYCFRQWKEAREMNIKRLKSNSALRELNSALRESNTRLRKAKPEHRETETLYKKLLAAQTKTKELTEFIEEVVAANKGLVEQIEELENECEDWAESQKFWREDSHVQGKAYNDELDKNDELIKINQHLRSKNIRLQQMLATKLIPVPDSPGLAIISYPN